MHKSKKKENIYEVNNTVTDKVSLVATYALVQYIIYLLLYLQHITQKCLRKAQFETSKNHYFKVPTSDPTNTR